jgi:hypothetical protein
MIIIASTFDHFKLKLQSDASKHIRILSNHDNTFMKTIYRQEARNDKISRDFFEKKISAKIFADSIAAREQ